MQSITYRHGTGFALLETSPNLHASAQQPQSARLNVVSTSSHLTSWHPSTAIAHRFVAIRIGCPRVHASIPERNGLSDCRQTSVTTPCGFQFARRGLPATRRWLAMLAPDVQPQALAAQFPRLANRIAADWGSPEMCRSFLYQLLVDRRGNRQGFPANVTGEILALRSLYSELHPATEGIANMLNW